MLAAAILMVRAQPGQQQLLQQQQAVAVAVAVAALQLLLPAAAAAAAAAWVWRRLPFACRCLYQPRSLVGPMQAMPASLQPTELSPFLWAPLDAVRFSSLLLKTQIMTWLSILIRSCPPVSPWSPGKRSSLHMLLQFSAFLY
jgi:hypothetical protein